MVVYRMDLSPEKRAAAIDVALASPENARRRKVGGRVLLVLGALIVLDAALVLALRGPNAPRLALLAIGVATLALSRCLEPFQRLVMRKSERLLDESFRSGVVEYRFDDDGVTIESRVGHSVCYWSSFREYGTAGSYLYLKRGDNRLVLVDKNDLSEAELAELTRLVSAHVPAHS